MDPTGLLRVANTTFEGNSLTSLSQAFGGAVHTEGSLVLEGGVVFRANSVSGDLKGGGGAIAVQTATSSLNANCLPGPVFVGNVVRLRACAALLQCCCDQGPVPLVSSPLHPLACMVGPRP